VRAFLLCISSSTKKRTLYCLLSIVYCILSIVYCLLSIVYCLLSIVYCLAALVPDTPRDEARRRRPPRGARRVGTGTGGRLLCCSPMPWPFAVSPLLTYLWRNPASGVLGALGACFSSLTQGYGFLHAGTGTASSLLLIPPAGAAVAPPAAVSRPRLRLLELLAASSCQCCQCCQSAAGLPTSA
jgi:hypothetical protein